MTAPDSRPVLDVIADVQRRHAWSAAFGGCSGGCEWVADPQDETEEDQHAAHVAAAVVAACQGATVEQQSELVCGTVGLRRFLHVEEHQAFVGWGRRAIGPWREDPS